MGNLSDVVGNSFRFVGLFTASVFKAVDEFLLAGTCVVIRLWLLNFVVGGRRAGYRGDSRCFGAEGLLRLRVFGI